jgi:glutaredoxin
MSVLAAIPDRGLWRMNEIIDLYVDEPIRVVLYTRRGCHLCDEAQRILEAHGLMPDCVDIDTDPALRERFDTCVPVVEIDGQIRFRGRVEPVLLRRLMGRGSGRQDH